MLDEWTSCLERDDPVDALYLDFRKAFDSIPRQRLSHKLQEYGITGKLNKWIASFLSDRHQQVTVRGCNSPWAPVSTGVLQGSVLGPVLFIIYINDLPDAVCSSSSIKIFADDTKIYRNVSLSSGSEQLQRELDALVVWSDMWQLPIHTVKQNATLSILALVTHAAPTPCGGLYWRQLLPRKTWASSWTRCWSFKNKLQLQLLRKTRC